MFSAVKYPVCSARSVTLRLQLIRVLAIERTGVWLDPDLVEISRIARSRGSGLHEPLSQALIPFIWKRS